MKVNGRTQRLLDSHKKTLRKIKKGSGRYSEEKEGKCLEGKIVHWKEHVKEG